MRNAQLLMCDFVQSRRLCYPLDFITNYELCRIQVDSANLKLGDMFGKN